MFASFHTAPRNSSDLQTRTACLNFVLLIFVSLNGQSTVELVSARVDGHVITPLSCSSPVLLELQQPTEQRKRSIQQSLRFK